MARSRSSRSPSSAPRRTSHHPRRVIPMMLLCCCVLLLLALAVGLTDLRRDLPEESSAGEAVPVAADLRETESLSPQEDAAALESQALDQSQPLMEEQTSSSQSFDGFSAGGQAQEDTLTEEEALNALNQLRDTFPEGKYWNHMGLESWDQYTVTDTPCQHDMYWDAYCNGYSGGIQELFPQFVPMEQCLGFAALLSDLVFGEDAPVSTFTDYTQLRSGDHIRLQLSEHSMTVLTVDEDGITVVECNSDYEHCRINWDRFLSWEDLAAYQYEMECITRYEN